MGVRMTRILLEDSYQYHIGGVEWLWPTGLVGAAAALACAVPMKQSGRPKAEKGAKFVWFSTILTHYDASGLSELSRHRGRVVKAMDC